MAVRRGPRAVCWHGLMSSVWLRAFCDEAKRGRPLTYETYLGENRPMAQTCSCSTFHIQSVPPELSLDNRHKYHLAQGLCKLWVASLYREKIRSHTDPKSVTIGTSVVFFPLFRLQHLPVTIMNNLLYLLSLIITLQIFWNTTCLSIASYHHNDIIILIHTSKF